MDTIAKIIDDIIRVEGGYVNDAADRGGETKYGITIAVAREFGYVNAMRDMPVEVARDIYYQLYVVKPKFDEVVKLDAAIGTELIDTGVNMGFRKSGEFLQRALNALNYQDRYPMLKVDGAIGGATLSALKVYLGWRGKEGAEVLLRALNSIQCVRYIEICEGNPTQKKFIYGWIRERVVI